MNQRLLFVVINILVLFSFAIQSHAQQWSVVAKGSFDSQLETDNYNYGASLAHHKNCLAIGGNTRKGIVEILKKNEQTKQWIIEQRIEGVGAIGLGKQVALHDNVLAIGVSNPQSRASRSGAVRIYRKNGVKWEQEVILYPSKNESNIDYGHQLTFISATQLIISAPGYENSATPEANTQTGALFVYTYSNGQWVNTQTITHELATYKRFGNVFAFDGGRLVVGIQVPKDNQLTDPSLLIYEIDGEKFVKTNQLVASERLDGFPYKIALWRNDLITSTRAINGPDSLFAYTLPDTLSDPIAPPTKIKYSLETNSNSFGHALVVREDTMIVSNQDLTPTKARVILYKKEQDQWVERHQIQHVDKNLTTDQSAFSAFGEQLILTPDELFISAPRERVVRGQVLSYNIFKSEVSEINTSSADDSMGWSLTNVMDQLIFSAPSESFPISNSGQVYLLDPNTNTDQGLMNTSNTPNAFFGANIKHNANYLAISAPGEHIAIYDPAQKPPKFLYEVKPQATRKFFGAHIHLSSENYLYVQHTDEVAQPVVEVFKLADNQATYITTLSVDPIDAPHFGYSITSIGKDIFIGAPNEDNAKDGAVFVIQRSGDTFTPAQRLEISTHSGFGTSLAAIDDTLFIGDVPQTNYDPALFTQSICRGASRIHTYKKVTSWTLNQTIESPNNETNCFASRLYVAKDTLFAAAPNYNVHKDTNGPIYNSSGALFALNQFSQLWSIQLGMNLNNAQNKAFGHGVAAIDGNLYVISYRGGTNRLHKMSMTTTISAPEADTITPNDQPTFKGSASPNSIVTLQFTEGPNQGLVVSQKTNIHGQWQHALTQKLDNGEHTIVIDSSYNEAMYSPSLTRKLTIDTAIPDKPVVTAPLGLLTNDNMQIIEGTTSPNANVTCDIRATFDGVLFQTTLNDMSDDQGFWQCIVTQPLADGTYTIAIKATSPLGNESLVTTIELSVDTLAPPTPIINSIDTTSELVTIFGEAEPNSTVTIRLNIDEEEKSVDVDEQGKWNIILDTNFGDVISQELVYYLQTFAQDKVGNQSAFLVKTFHFNDVKPQPFNDRRPTLKPFEEFAPNARVVITIIQDNDPSVFYTYQSKTDDEGQWSFTVPNPLQHGIYTVIAEIKSEDGETLDVYVFKIRIRYTAPYYEPSYCQSTHGKQPTGMWLFMALGCVGLLGRRQRKQYGAKRSTNQR